MTIKNTPEVEEDEDEEIEHDIQIDVESLPKPAQNLINKTIELADEWDVRVVLSKERSVPISDAEDSGQCNGTFSEDPPELTVACGQPFEKWFTIFIHEGCHMDQWIEECPAWVDGKILGVEAYQLLELWLQHKIELTEEQKQAIIYPSMFIELDCERRVAKKIKELNLPLDVEYYCQRANAYVYFYHLMGLTREWYEIGKEPYNYPEIVEKMPTNLDGDYETLPQGIKEVMVANLYPDRYNELCGTKP